MPSKYPDETKRQAVGMLQIHDDISLVHFKTGIPRRTLRDWRKELRNEPNRQTAEKTFSSAANSPSGTPSDYEDFAYIRQQLMQYARHMATDLRPDEPDSNRRTLALSRILDRIQRLDQFLPAKAKAEERPIWQDAYDDLVSLNLNLRDLIRIETKAKEEDDRIKAHIYKVYAKLYRERGYIP